MSYYLNYYVDLKNAKVDDEIAILRTEFRDMLLNYGEDNIYEVYKVLKSIMFDEMFLLVHNEHSNNFKNLNEYQFNDSVDDDVAKVLKKMNIDYCVDSKPLQHFSDEQLREELYKRNTNGTDEELELIDSEPLFDLDLDLNLDDDEEEEKVSDELNLDDLNLDLDFDDDEDLDLDFGEEDYDSEIALATPNTMSLKAKILEFLAEYCKPLGSYVTTAKFTEVFDCSTYKYKPFLDELIEKELVIMSEPMHNHCRINCYSVTAKGYQTLSEIYLFDESDKSDYYNKTAALLRKYNSDIQTSERLVDLFFTHEDRVRFDNLEVVEVVEDFEDFEDLLKELDKPVSENDIAIHYKNKWHSFKYTDLRIFASIFKRLESYSGNDEYVEVIEALRSAYVDDTRTLMKYMRVISLNHKHRLNTWFKQKTSRCIDSFVGDSSLVHEDGLEALVTNGWLKKSYTNDLYRVTELGKTYL
ncbi:hypothetical protein MADA3029_740054 [Vibrio nigripulchritudo MADA3029]|uniref:hypothetical protein n=1 Tax=Vibrio nigripulchritudo TaxID=28173 RepID=UPI0003B181B3|nr:hypothetical protein [Vibrio nigripulchritudo]CCN46009.1 hypothetical protein VIBNIMADA3020_1180039 [Vibrio nigripulchritudo MADA3020]CCN54133.1 hypothetical protein VIBNIMADA3021_510056 [Vibrio nigripulchritudo MADA3021]CCN61203.1 hypothetical protein MADA3029_740054 [Vibrio nigripulchritudo MADA3029]